MSNQDTPSAIACRLRLSAAAADLRDAESRVSEALSAHYEDDQFADWPIWERLREVPEDVRAAWRAADDAFKAARQEAARAGHARFGRYGFVWLR